MCGFVTSRTGGDGTSKTPSRCADGGESDAGAPTAKEVTAAASTYQELGRYEDALRIERGAYSGRLKFLGEEHPQTLLTANNYADSLNSLKHFKEAKALMRKTIPVARRVLGDSCDLTLGMHLNYARSLCNDPGATLDNLREAVGTLEETGPIARRVLGGAHPLAMKIEASLRIARAALRAREATST